MNGDIVPISALSSNEKQQMHALLGAHFEGASRDQFEIDLNEKTAAILLRDGTGLIRGFSTLLVYRSKASADSVGVVYSGDTIVDAVCRNSPILARTWIHAARDLVAPLSCHRNVWLLIVSGFRTYRFLPVFWREFIPRDNPANHRDTQLLRTLAAERFAAAFDPSSGIVRLPSPQRLRGSAADIPLGKRSDPHVRFFLDKNPGHAQGDELACLCDLHESNLTPAGRRMVFGSAAERAK